MDFDYFCVRLRSTHYYERFVKPFCGALGLVLKTNKKTSTFPRNFSTIPQVFEIYKKSTEYSNQYFDIKIEMAQKIYLFFLTSTAAQKNYEYNDIFDYLSGNLTFDEYFEENEEIRAKYENSHEETFPKIFGYASLSVSENVEIIVPQIVSEIQKLENINKKMRTSDLPTFLVDLFSDPTYKIQDPYVEELVQRILEKLRETGVDPVTISPNLRYSRCPLYWLPLKDSQQCIPSSYLYKVSIKISIKHKPFYLIKIFKLFDF